MNRGSPRVVAMGRKPLRSTVGERISQTVMATSISATQMKNTAVGVVQTIQANMAYSFSGGRGSDPAHREALRDVVAHEPDDDGAGDDGVGAGRREGGPINVRGLARAVLV